MLGCHIQYKVKVLKEPKLINGYWNYEVQLLRKEYYIFGIRIWTIKNKIYD